MLYPQNGDRIVAVCFVTSFHPVYMERKCADNYNKQHSKFSSLNRNQHFPVSQFCLIKLLPCILFEKYIYILALEVASPRSQHCANCIGTLSFLMTAPSCVRRLSVSIVDLREKNL